MKRWNTMKNRLAAGAAALVLGVSVLGSSGVVRAAEFERTELNRFATSDATTENVAADANGTLGKNSDVGIQVTKSITGKTGKKVKIAFQLQSKDAARVKLKDVYPVIDSSFPFETSGDAYKVVSADGDAGKQANLDAEFTMTARSDLETGYQSVRFLGEYSKVADDGSVADYYVLKTINIYFSGTATTAAYTPSASTPSASTPVYDDDDDDDEPSYTPSRTISSGGSSDSDSDTEAAAPKLIITGFETEPERVMAGDTFKLKIHVQNSSKTTSVCNGKFLIGDENGNFLPTSGSNAVYVESIPADKTGDLEIELKTSAELAQKNYRLLIKGDFDDGKGNTFSASESLYLPVYQQVKLAVSDVSMTPEAIGIGSTGTLDFTINNQGSAGVYNVKVNVKDEAATADENYVGNIAANSSAYASLQLTGANDNSETGTIKVSITYEDSEGNAGELEQDLKCSIGEDAPISDIDDEFDMDFDDEDEEDEEIPKWLIAVIIAVVVVLIAVIVIIINKKRKKRLAALMDEDEDLDFTDNMDETM